MNNNIAMIMSFLALVCNLTLCLQIFPSRVKLRVFITLSVCFLAVQMLLRFTVGSVYFKLGGFHGLLYFPLYIIVLRGRFFQKIFFFLFQIVFTFSMAILVTIIALFLFKEDNIGYNIFRLVLIILIYASYAVWVTKNLSVLYEKVFTYGTTKEWALYSFVGLIAFGMIGVARGTVSNIFILVAIVFFVLLSFAILCFAIINTNEKTKEHIEAEFIQDIRSYGWEHYHKMNEMYDKLQLLRRDFRHYLNTARDMLHSGNTEEADRYLTNIEQQMAGIEKAVYCRIFFINNLIVGYEDRCKELKIQCTIRIVIPESISVPDYDMCIILGSLLENAVEACMKLEHHRFIELETHIKMSQLLIMVKNSFNGIVITDETGSLVTTKTNGGIGLRGVKEIVSRHSGDLLTEWTGDTFTAYAAVKAMV